MTPVSAGANWRSTFRITAADAGPIRDAIMASCAVSATFFCMSCRTSANVVRSEPVGGVTVGAEYDTDRSSVNVVDGDTLPVSHITVYWPATVGAVRVTV